MLKWLLVMAVGVALLSAVAPALGRFGLGRLPGDLRFRRNGREYHVPIASTIILSLLLTLVVRIL